MDPEKVRLIFKETYGLYRLFQNEELFRIIIDNIMNETPERVSGIMAGTYNFYLKWKDNQDFGQLWVEAKEINCKYNDCELCKTILLILCNVIEQDFKQKEVSGWR